MDRNRLAPLLRLLPFSALAWRDGRLVHWSIWRYEWTRDGDVAYAQGPGLSYRHFGDLVVTRIWRVIKYHRAGECAATSIGRLIVYRKVAGIRTFRPSFKFF